MFFLFCPPRTGFAKIDTQGGIIEKKSYFCIVVVTNATCLTMSDRGPRNSSWQRATCTHVVIRSFEHHPGDSLFWLCPTPILRENTLWMARGASHLYSPSIYLTRGLVARRLFRVPPCRKGTLHLQTSMSSSVLEPSPYGTAVSVANHYTGWVTFCNVTP
ncbi:hypothetical protein TNCV_3027861 [Trichonephila clavipes]|nr:hypothetical protein TNCV_3027861 [Trichonephila clavipes]